jgi:hypothetical protein
MLLEVKLDPWRTNSEVSLEIHDRRGANDGTEKTKFSKGKVVPVYKHQGLKTHTEVGIKLHTFLTSGLGTGE